MSKTFGILGAGNIGRTVARHLVNAGYSVILSNSRGPASLHALADELGPNARAGILEEAARAEIVVLSLPWLQLPNVLSKLPSWDNRIVIDATNHFIASAPEFVLANLGGKGSSEVVAGYLPGARVVKAFNTLYFKILEADPKTANGRRVLFISGDDADAKKEVSGAIETIGFAVIDLGALAAGGKMQQAGAPLAGQNLVKMG
jgi:predicted dinucleotide-binding enzyme